MARGRPSILLLQQALKDAHAASCRKIQLLSHKRHGNDGAHDLYRAMGFTPKAEGFRLYLDPSPHQAEHDHLASLVPASGRI
jgi:single-stranded DNA-specific DHH superfamily exonuclease